MKADFCPFFFNSSHNIKARELDGHSLNQYLNIILKTLYTKIKHKASMGGFTQEGLASMPVYLTTISSNKCKVYEGNRQNHLE